MAVYNNLNLKLQGCAAREQVRDAEVQMIWKQASRCLFDLWSLPYHTY